jgi:hypothetical protein
VTVEIQQAVYNRLRATPAVVSAVTGIFDEVPQGQAYPYIAIGEDTVAEWDTDTFTGFEATLTLHTWSRKAGRLECKTIMDRVYGTLHRETFDIDGGIVVLCNVEFQETFLEADGVTRHGVQRVRLVIQEG